MEHCSWRRLTIHRQWKKCIGSTLVVERVSEGQKKYQNFSISPPKKYLTKIFGPENLFDPMFLTLGLSLELNFFVDSKLVSSHLFYKLQIIWDPNFFGNYNFLLKQIFLWKQCFWNQVFFDKTGTKLSVGGYNIFVMGDFVEVHAIFCLGTINQTW